MSDFPPLPSLIRGTAGPIKVRLRRNLKLDGQGCWGLWDGAKRIIAIDKTAPIEHQWRVLFHELVHAALHDAGLENVMEEQAIEAICDAMSASRIQEFRGQLGIMDA